MYNNKTPKMNALDYFSEVKLEVKNMVRNLQLKAQRPEKQRVITRKFPLDFQAHLLGMSTKRIRDLVKGGTLQCRSYIESNSFKFSQEEIYHNLEIRDSLPKTGSRPTVIVISQYKGGVGKTTATTNLGVYLALFGCQ